MSQPPFIQRLKLKNVLSFDSTGVDVELRHLNILIGINGSGKSNFLYAIELLKSLPTGLWEFLREGGGLSEWQYKSGYSDDSDWGDGSISFEAILNLRDAIDYSTSTNPLKYAISFHIDRDNLDKQDRLSLFSEYLGFETERPDYKPYDWHYRHYGDERVISSISNSGEVVKNVLPAQKMSYRKSIFEQVRDRINYPELGYVGNAFESIGVYSGLPFGKDAPYRKPQEAGNFDEENLAPDGSNLAIVLNYINAWDNDAMETVLKEFKRILSRTKAITPQTTSNLIRLFVQEVIGGKTVRISAYRLSDGTLRFLCLLVILLSPNPPPLICIEEPETGMHPEMLLVIAELLKEASTRTQIIVTTHSDILLSMFEPEDVLVCEHDGAKSSIKRLSSDDLKSWIEDDYRLGEMWLSNAFGGVR